MDIAILTTLAGIVEYAVPVLFASIGENVTEKAGLTNLSVNGTIILASMGGFVVALNTNSILLGFIMGALIGAAVAAIVAFSSITPIIRPAKRIKTLMIHHHKTFLHPGVVISPSFPAKTFQA